MNAISKQQIEQMDSRYRATFINSLAGYKQPVLVGTCSLSGIANLALFNSLLHIGANPALFGLLVRPDTVPRDTLQNIRETRVFSINWMSADNVVQMHQTAARYPSSVSEFEEVGFQQLTSSDCAAPRVAEAAISASLHCEQIIDIPLNGTHLVIGSIQQVFLPEDWIQSDGYIALHRGKILSVVGLDAYYRPQPYIRLSYPRPGSSCQPLPWDAQDNIQLNHEAS